MVLHKGGLLGGAGLMGGILAAGKKAGSFIGRHALSGLGSLAENVLIPALRPVIPYLGVIEAAATLGPLAYKGGKYLIGKGTQMY